MAPREKSKRAATSSTATRMPSSSSSSSSSSPSSVASGPHRKAWRGRALAAAFSPRETVSLTSAAVLGRARTGQCCLPALISWNRAEAVQRHQLGSGVAAPKPKAPVRGLSLVSERRPAPPGPLGPGGGPRARASCPRGASCRPRWASGRGCLGHYSPPEPRSEASSSAGFRPGNFFQLFALPSRGVFPESPPQTPSSPLPFTPSPFFARGIGHGGGPARTGQDRPQPRPQRPP